MPGEDLEFRIVGGMKASVGHEKDFALAGGVGEAADVGQQLLRARDIEISSRQHEVALHVYFPEYEVA
jgi:hypothetical protein